MKKPKLSLYIDPAVGCPLRCPTCHTGVTVPKVQLIEMGLLYKILEKARKEADIEFIGLYSYSEPTLHPQLAQMIRVCTDYTKNVRISSNMNLSPQGGWESIVDAGLRTLVISISGSKQETYQIGHAGGKIDKLWKNLDEFLIARGARKYPKALMLFHRYKHNVEDEKCLKEYCKSRRIRFYPVWAIRGNREDQLRGKPCKLDDALCFDWKRFLEPPKHLWKKCPVGKELAITHDGRVRICCGCTEDTSMIGNFLDMPLEAIQEKRFNSDLCKACWNTNLVEMLMYPSPAIDLMDIERVGVIGAYKNMLKSFLQRKIQYWEY